jgi:hypothetical protein
MDWRATIEKMRFEEGKSYGEIAKYTMTEFPDLTRNQAYYKGRDVLRRNPSNRDVKPQDFQKSSIEYKNDGSIISEKFIEVRDGDEMTPEFLLEAHGLKIGLWEVTSYKNNMWNSQDKEGRQIMYQSKLVAKPLKNGIDFDEIKKLFGELDRKKYTPVTIKKSAATVMAEVNICDLHLGKLCWSGETLENYDHKIARDLFHQLISEIVLELKKQPIDYITFIWTHDFFNSDDENQETTGGTPQDTDTRVKKLFPIGVHMLEAGIETLLREIKRPVKTFYVRSNHDEMTSFFAMMVLEAYFRKEPNVEILTNAYPRKYQMYGNTLIGYCHGDKEKAARLASLMPIEAREMWSMTKWHEMHTAHLHSEHMIQEVNGVIVRRISSPTALDQWHTDSGFIGAVRKAQTFIYDKEWGLVQTINTPVKEVKE